jgi:tetratricopeptide (TPR) repeat protein
MSLSILSGAVVNFNSNLTINGHLKTEEATLKFASGTGIVINGSAICDGTTFTGINSYNNWNGINIYSAPTLSKSFYYCNISYGIYGINVNQTHVSLRWTKIHNTKYATNFTNWGTGDIAPNNIFDLNNWADIRVDATSIINAGGTPFTPGCNSFRRPGPRQIYSENSSALYACGNYWDIGPVNYGTIITAGEFPYDINASISSGDDHRAEIESGIFLKQRVIKDDKPIEKVPGIEELDRAMQLFFNKKYEEALAEMHRLVEKYKDGYVGKSALVFIENILVETDRANEVLPMLERYSSGKSKVAQYAHYRKGYQHLYLKEYDKAIEIMKGTEFTEEDVYLKQVRLYDLGVIYLDFIDNKLEGYNYFSELVNTYPECILSDVANTFYIKTKDGYEKPPEGDKEVATVTETKLFANYPNPFNPSTVIKYQLSDASQVSLRVYDVMGREVATLVDSYQNKGNYDVTFNANNLASGIYIYKLNAGGKQLINKMLLMK